MEDIWIRDARFDLAFVMGGALLTLALPLFVGAVPWLLPVFFWTWLVGFEGSHFWATLSRTYFDRDFSRQAPLVLKGSLVFFLFPLLAVAARRATGDATPMAVYGLGIFVWSLYHNARQHFGFLSIYLRKSGESPSVARSYRTLLYVCVGAAQVHFLFHFKGAAAWPAFPAFATLPRAWQGALTAGPYAVSAASAAWLLVLAARSHKAGGAGALVPALYTAVCLAFYAVMFYAVAPREPFFSSPANGAQTLMMVTIMNSLFHNIQYHAIVWHYSRRRYAAPSSASAADRFGWAAVMNRTFARYAVVSVASGAVFAGIVWCLGDWPSVRGLQPDALSGTIGSLAYILYFGIVGHHFYLDQKIWRPSVQKDLNSYLGLPQERLTAAA